MSVRISVLASGSQGNASLLRGCGPGLLLDLGLGARALGARLESVGSGWDQLGAALLTHTHGDHVSDAALAALARHGVPLYCHEGHRPRLDRCAGFEALQRAALVRTYDDRPFLAPGGFQVEPIEVRHDGGPTFGFRVQGRDGRRGRPASIGYLSDSGCWTDAMADGLTDVDLLAVEFNHDVDLQRRSGRPYPLIARNLGDGGHLSNDQGADLLASVLARSGRGAVRQVVLLHLSGQCNRHELALAAARGAVRGTGRRVAVHVARQHDPSPDLAVAAPRSRRPVSRVRGFPWE